MHCRERAVSPATIPSYQSEVEHDGRRYTIAVDHLKVLQCGNCGAIVLDDAANRRISDALRTAAGLMIPEATADR
jgi:hypothetical protein